MRSSPFFACAFAALLLVGAVAPGFAAASSPVRVCGRVANAAGWALEGVEVRASSAEVRGSLVNDLLNLAASPDAGSESVNVTDAEGRFSLLLAPGSTYRVVARDREGPASPMRGGAAYAAQARDGVVPSAGAVVAGACADGEAGQVLAPFVLDAPGQGFLQVVVRDAIAAGAPLLAGVNVSRAPVVVPDAGGATLRPTHAVTDGAGVARLACAGGAPAVLDVSRDGWIARHTLQATCATGAKADVAVSLWRTPLELVLQVSNTTGVVRMATGSDRVGAGEQSVEADSMTPDTPLPTARAAATLSGDLASAPALCPAAPAAQVGVRAPPVDSATTPYVCEAGADAAGVISLLLPWSSFAPDVTHAVRVHAAAYADKTLEVDVSLADVSGASAPVRVTPVVLERGSVPFSVTLRNVSGAPGVGASVAFDGGLPLVADATGTVSTTLTTGPHRVAISSAGNVSRDCTFDVEASDGAGVVRNAVPTYCFTLVSTGKVGVMGVAADNLVPAARVADLRVCHNASGACARTDAQGAWGLEVPTSTALTAINLASGQEWGTMPLTGTASATAGAVTVLAAPATAVRTAIPIQLKVVDAEDAPVAAAETTLKRGATAIALAYPNNLTGAAGTVTYAASTFWTKKAGAPQFDVAPYVATAASHGVAGDNATHNGTASHAFDVPSAPSAPVVETLVLSPEENVFSVAVTATDLHTGASIATIVAATPATPGTNPVVTAGPRNVEVTPGSLVLYGEHAPYKVCARATPEYQASSAAAAGPSACATGVATDGQVVSLGVFRTLVPVAVTAFDAHTGAPLSAYNVTVAGPAGFACGPTGGNAQCSRNVAAAPMSVPWGELCFQGTARAYAVQLVAGAPDQAQENVAFQASKDCRAVAPQATGVAVALRPLRAAGPALAGSVLDPNARPVPGAIVRIASDREGFVCNPATHSTPDASFPACDATTPSATGAFSALVPAGGQNTTWNLTASAAGFHDASYNLSTPALAQTRPDLVLWPTSFVAVVTIQDVSAGPALATGPGSRGVPATSHACGDDEDLPVTVFVRDLQTLAERSTVATARADGTCQALVTIDEWHHDARTLPAALGAKGAKSTHPFLLIADQSGHIGGALALLGPKDADRAASVAMADTSTRAGGAAGFSVRGRAFDAGLANAAAQNAGLPASIVVSGGCDPAFTMTVQATPDGAFNASLPCAGTYTVRATPTVATLWGAVTKTVTVSADARHGTADLGMPRLTASLKVFTSKVQGGVARGATINPSPVDGSYDPPAQVATTGSTTFAPIPWGTYLLVASGGGTPVPQTPVFVQPGSNSATVFYVS